MHESERHRIILSAVQERPVVTVPDLCQLTGASEATICACVSKAILRPPRMPRRRIGALGSLIEDARATLQ